jgi:hypothetical protein
VQLYDQLVNVAKKKTAVADRQMDDRGKRIDGKAEDFGENVLVIDEEDSPNNGSADTGDGLSS